MFYPITDKTGWENFTQSVPIRGHKLKVLKHCKQVTASASKGGCIHSNKHYTIR